MNQDDWKIINMLEDNKSISVTAEKLFLTQPTLTRRIQKMEQELGVSIVRRTSKGVTLTSEGKLVAQQARKMLGEYDALLVNLGKIKNKVYGTVRIGVSNSLARFMLPDLLAACKEKYPLLSYDVTTGFSSDIVRKVYNRDIHIGFVRGDHFSILRKYLIRTDHATIISSTPIVMKDLPQMPRIDFYADTPSQAIIDTWWYDTFTELPYIAMRLKSGSTCYELIRRGFGYGVFLTNDFLSDEDTHLYRQKAFYKDGKPVIRNNWMVCRDDMMEEPYMDAFWDFCREYFEGGGYGADNV
jgi:DNA-binding transcriptional LysR family regulator